MSIQRFEKRWKSAREEARRRATLERRQDSPNTRRRMAKNATLLISPSTAEVVESASHSNTTSKTAERKRTKARAEPLEPNDRPSSRDEPSGNFEAATEASQRPKPLPWTMAHTTKHVERTRGMASVKSPNAPCSPTKAINEANTTPAMKRGKMQILNDNSSRLKRPWACSSGSSGN